MYILLHLNGIEKWIAWLYLLCARSDCDWNCGSVCPGLKSAHSSTICILGNDKFNGEGSKSWVLVLRNSCVTWCTWHVRFVLSDLSPALCPPGVSVVSTVAYYIIMYTIFASEGCVWSKLVWHSPVSSCVLTLQPRWQCTASTLHTRTTSTLHTRTCITSTLLYIHVQHLHYSSEDVVRTYFEVRCTCTMYMLH